MTTDQAIAEIIASNPRCCWGFVPASRFVDVSAVARRAFVELPIAQGQLNSVAPRSLAGWFAFGVWGKQRLKKRICQSIKGDCQPKAGCAFILVWLSLPFAWLVEAAIAAVVEACVCWWMEHRVLPKD